MTYFDVKPKAKNILASCADQLNYIISLHISCSIYSHKIPVRKYIHVDIAENDQDWQFDFIDAGNGKKQMAEF